MKKINFKVIDEEKKTQFTRIGLGLSGFAVSDATAELLWRMIKRIDEKKEKFSVQDGVELVDLIKIKYEKKSTKQRLNK